MPNIDHYRKAAISVYFLNKNDQQWVLSNLMAEEKQKLSIYLDDLKDLALPRDQLTKKTILSYLDIPLDDDLYGLLTEILDKDCSLLVDYINDEPSWLGSYLINEYPVLFDVAFKNKLSIHKLNDINNHKKNGRQELTITARRAVFKSVQNKLMNIYLGTHSAEMNFSNFMDKYESASQDNK